MTFGSRAKGNKAELEIAARLEKWWQPVEPGCKVCRVPLSGGWRSPEHRESFALSGDLMTDAKLFPWCPEIKRREGGWTEKNLALGKPTAVWSWWRQAQSSALEVGKMPALFFRKSRRPWLLMLPQTYVALLPGELPPPLHEWEELGVDYGGLMPVVYPAGEILALPPQVFVADAAQVAEYG